MNAKLEIPTKEMFKNEEVSDEKIEPLELGGDLVRERLAEKRYFLHGNNSPVDSENIAKQGLKATEGRATVSCNLVHAFTWASSAEKRNAYSLSTTPTEKESIGSVFVVEKPKQYSFGLANFTDFEIDTQKKEIRGQPLKWASAYKQIGIFSEQDVGNRREKLEAITRDMRSKVTVNSVFQLTPSQQTAEVLQELESQTKNFSPPNMQGLIAGLQESLGLKHDIASELTESTIESIIITRLRIKALEIKAAQGYTIYNYANKPTTHFNKTSEEIKAELLKWQNNLQQDSTLGIKWLDEYAKDNIDHLLKELK